MRTFLSYIGVAPIQLSPNVYTHLQSLKMLVLESGLPPLSPEILTSFTKLARSSKSNKQIFKVNIYKKSILDGINKFKDRENLPRPLAMQIKGSLLLGLWLLDILGVG